MYAPTSVRPRPRCRRILRWRAAPEADPTFRSHAPARQEEVEELGILVTPWDGKATSVVCEMGRASTSTLQRRLRLGAPRGAHSRHDVPRRWPGLIAWAVLGARHFDCRQLADRAAVAMKSKPAGALVAILSATALFAVTPRPLPDIPISTPAGKPINLKQFRGKVVLMAVISADCAACTASIVS